MVTKLLVLVLVSAVSNVNALDIKGIKVGEQANCEVIRSLEIREGTFAKSCENGISMWIHVVSFLNGKATLGIQQNSQRVVTSLSVSDFSFSDALDAFTLKFGQPAIEKSLIQNRMGATFEQVTAVWVDGEDVMSLKKHGARLQQPSLVLTNKTALAAEGQGRLERATKGAGNI